VLFGIQLVVAGIFQFVAAFGHGRGERRDPGAAGAARRAVVHRRLYALRHIVITIATLGLLLGIFWVVNGAVETFAALSHRPMPGRGWTIVMACSAW
jgi:uncharacterized membrane protein HdeD (DUF308 family)